MKREIYSLDKKIYDFLEKNIEKSFSIENDGYSIKYEGGHMYIFYYPILKNNEKVVIYFHKNSEEEVEKGYKNTVLYSHYEFSPVYSQYVRDLLYSKIDKIDTAWKEEHNKITSLIDNIQKLEDEEETKIFIEEIENKIKDGLTEGKKEFSLYITKKNDYKENLTTTLGFGVNDLKDKYFNCYHHLISKYKKNIIVVPKDLINFEVEILYSENI